MRLVAVFGWVCLFLFSSCEDVDKVNFSLTQTVVFALSESETNSGGRHYDVSAPLDITRNADVITYANKIEEIKISLVEYEISDANPQDVFLNEASVSTSQGLSIASVSSLPLNNRSGQLTPNAPGVTDLVTRLQNSGKDQLKLSGYLTRTPVACTVTVTFHLNVKARVI